MIQMQPERLCIKFVDEFAADRNWIKPVHTRQVKAMKVDRVRMAGAIDEADANPVAFGGANRRAGYAAIVCPRRKENARRNLDLFFDREKFVLVQRAPIGQGADLTVIEVGQHRCRIELIDVVGIDIARHDVIAMTGRVGINCML